MQSSVPDEAAGDAATALALMSHYLRRPCPVVAGAIAACLARLPQFRGDAPLHALHGLADALLPQWRQLAAAPRH